MTSDSFQDVLSRLRAGDHQAASEVFNRFAGRLIALARSRLDARVLSKIDPEDVVQSACKSFFIRHAEGQFEVATWDSLWTLLTVLTVRKCANQIKHYRTGRRDVRREVAASAEESTEGWVAVDRAPTPEETVMLVETVEELMRGLDERDRQILALSLQGKTAEEISVEIGYAQRTVRRVLGHIKDRLQTAATEVL